MNMLWNTDIINTCIVFRQWHITSNLSFVFSFFIIVGLGVLYEYLRAFQRDVDVRIAESILAGKTKGKGRVTFTPSSGRSSPGDDQFEEEAGLLSARVTAKGGKHSAGSLVPPVHRATRAALYGVLIFLSFFLMLVFMTYNAYLILAIVLGAALGHYIFGARMDVESVLAASGAGAKGMACH